MRRPSSSSNRISRIPDIAFLAVLPRKLRPLRDYAAELQQQIFVRRAGQRVASNIKQSWEERGGARRGYCTGGFSLIQPRHLSGPEVRGGPLWPRRRPVTQAAISSRPVCVPRGAYRRRRRFYAPPIRRRRAFPRKPRGTPNFKSPGRLGRFPSCGFLVCCWGFPERKI